MIEELEDVRGEKVVPIERHLRRIRGVKKRSVNLTFREAHFRLNRRVTTKDVTKAAESAGLRATKHDFYFKITNPAEPENLPYMYVDTGISPLMIVHGHMHVIDFGKSAMLKFIGELARRTKKPRLTERFGKWWTREKSYRELIAELEKIPGVRETKQPRPYEIRLSFNRKVTSDAIARAARVAGLTVAPSEGDQEGWHIVYSQLRQGKEYRHLIVLVTAAGRPVLIRRTWAFGEELEPRQKRQLCQFFSELAANTRE